MNYKAHKPEKGFPGRMITSGCGSSTDRLSSWCEYHLKTLMKKLPDRLEDTSHFLQKLIEYNNTSATQEDNPKMILCPWDIEAMYPNITNDLGLTACRELLNKRDHLVPLNKLHPRLKFTKEYSTSSIVFLDLRFTISGNQIISGMYSKPSDTHAYLMPTSCHPSHICKNIPRGVMKRVKRNCSSDTICKEGYAEFKQHLIRGYSNTIIDKAIEQAKSIPWEVFLGSNNSNDTVKSNLRQFPLVMKFNPKLPPMSHYIHKHFHILELSNTSKHLFNKRTIFTSYRMERSILSMITRNNFKPPSAPLRLPPFTIPTPVHSPDPNWGCFPCPNTCTLCKNFLEQSLIFSSPKKSQTYKIKSHSNCNTKNIIYLILDLKCPDIFYVGYTTDSISVRWRNHKANIKANIKSCELAHHFIQLSDTTHKLDKLTQPIYTEQLSKHLAIILIEHIRLIQIRTFNPC